MYTLRGLAAKEKKSYGHLRRVAAGFKDGEPKVWRGYSFFQLSDKTWFAVEPGVEIEFIDDAGRDQQTPPG